MDSERVNQSMHERLPRIGLVLAAASLAVSGAVMHYDRSGTVEATPAVQSSAQPVPESVIISGKHTMNCQKGSICLKE